MAREMCDFGELGRVRAWETRIFLVIFLCVACHGVTSAQRESIPWMRSGSLPREDSDGEDTQAQVDRELSTAVPTSMLCYSCSSKATNAECNQLEREHCTDSQDSCQTELRYVNHQLQISKRCKQHRACQNNIRSNTQNCPGSNNDPVCFYCCQGSLCNIDLPTNPLTQVIDPRAVFILTYEVLYNTSQPSPVTSACGEFYAHRFLEKFVSAQTKLNESCGRLHVRVTVDLKARVRLYGNKVEVNTYINLSNNMQMLERHVNDCAELVRAKLRDFEVFESEVCDTGNHDCFSTIPTTADKSLCSEAQMSPRHFTLKTTHWQCPGSLAFHSDSKECRPPAPPTTRATMTMPPMTTVTITSSLPYSTTTSVEMVSPVNLTSAASDLSVVTPEPATVFTELTTAAIAMTTQSTTTTETETLPLATTESMVTQTWTSSWGVEILNQSSQLHLQEGGDTENVYFRLWVNKTELCGREGDCAVTLHFSLHPDPSANTPRCRSNDSEIPQVVIGQPSWVTSSVMSSSHDYCSMSVSKETVDSVNVLPLKAMLDWKYDDTQLQYLRATINVTRGGQTEVDQTLTLLPIIVENRDRKSTCQSINDPHVTTFDGLEYNNFYEGEFVLYRHTDLPFSVHAIYQLCDRQVLASCNCAVAVQSGDDVIVIDRCVRRRKSFKHIDGSFDHDPLTVMTVQLYLNGQLTPGTRLYQDSDGKKYFIYLPHGAYVKVMVSGPLVNVWIVPSPNDIGHTIGLCGTYDWDRSNEFHLRNGSVLEQGEEGEGKRPQPHEFILDWQVDLYGEDSIFHGVKRRSDQFFLHRYCSCVRGQPGACTPSHDISTCDIYQGSDVTNLFIKNAINLTATVKSRKRRAINENTILKTDEPILLNKGFIPKNTHPWKYGWNKTYARTFCSDYIRDNYTLGRLCAQIPGVNFDQEITTCVEDIHIIGNDSWADSAREAMKEQCLEEIQKNGNLPHNITTQIEAQMCVNDCSGTKQGHCVNGQCVCEKDFTSADCSVKVNEPPYKVELPKYGLCDRRYMRCDAVIVYGENFVNSVTLKCHLQKCQVTEISLIKLKDAPILEKAQYINFNAVECAIPTHNQSYIIKVTNDGEVLSAGLLFIPFDSRCNDCSTNYTKCTKKKHSCIIGGECYADKDKKDNSNDSCEVCDSDIHQYDWTTLEVPRCRPPWWQNVPDWVVALAAAIGGSLVGLLVGFYLYKCCCKSRRKPDPAQEVALDNQTDVIASSPFEDHMLHRNRGLPVYSGSGDQFADLTLRQPDYEETYFYNDGRGVENGIDSNTYFY